MEKGMSSYLHRILGYRQRWPLDLTSSLKKKTDCKTKKETEREGERQNKEQCFIVVSLYAQYSSENSKVTWNFNNKTKPF